MSRIVPSFRIVLAEEKVEWKPFRNALDKKEERRLTIYLTSQDYTF